MKSSSTSRRAPGCAHHELLGAALALSLAACGASADPALDGGLARDGAMHDASRGGAGGGDHGADVSGRDAAHGDGDGHDDGGGAVDPLDAASDGGPLEPADAGGNPSSESDAMLPALEDLPYAREVIAYEQGESAGFGQDGYPSVVFGPPTGKGAGSGSLDVLSLGVGGSVVIGFGDRAIVDGDGADFIVFENAFIGGGSLFMELGEISVSEDGVSWHTFPCDEQGAGGERFPGCAGWTPTLRFDPQRVVPLDPALTGGDAFDLSELGLSRASYVRIQDLGTKPGTSNTGGFDLDAIGLVHYE